MSKIIIHNKTGLSDKVSVALILSVINEGRISKSRGQDSYCLCTVIGKHVVLASRSKTGTDTFTIQDK